MGLFFKAKEERATAMVGVQARHEERLQKFQDKNENKARDKARLAGYDIEGALYVFTCLEDRDGGWSAIYGFIYSDRLVKCQKRLGSINSEEIPIKNVTSVEVSKGLTPTVTVHASGNSIHYKVGVEAPKIAAMIREQMSSLGSPTSTIDPVMQVEKLAGLMERGLLTLDEFERKKKDILGL